MRALFLLLLLANLLFAAWGYWVAPARAPVEGRATPSAAGGDAIRLLREAAPDDVATTRNGDAALDAADAALDCVSAGPYLEQALAEQAEQRLARLGFAVQLRQSRDTVRIGEWVRVEDLATPEDAANALAQIKAAGIADAYLLTDESPGTVISLGVFTDKGRAEQAVTIAKMAGYDPRTVERTREADVFWLDIDRPASAGLPSPDQLGADGSADAPAVGLRRCPQLAASAEPGATGSLPDM